MPRKKKSNHQLAQIKRFREQEAVNKRWKKILDVWAREYEHKTQIK